MDFSNRLFSAFQYVLPQHTISRLTHRLARWDSPFVRPLLRLFVQRYGLDMTEALPSTLDDYKSFNALFTRSLRPELRPLEENYSSVVSPADSAVSALGSIEEGQIYQAKGHHYSTLALLGGDTELAQHFHYGHFITVYLSPRDYHRLHMPLDGILTCMLHIPGRLFSVAPSAVAHIPGLFARNERVIAVFETPFGTMAMALIGALNVGSIETVWAGEVTPPAGRTVQRWDYPQGSIQLKKGEEMGRFNLGSSVVLLLPDHPFRFQDGLLPGKSVRVRQTIAQGDRSSINCSPKENPALL